MGGIFLLAALLAPKENFAAIGFNGANLTPANQLVCSGGQITITFSPTTCITGAGNDWSANYEIDSSFDNVNWFTPAGVTTGSINAASPPLVYSSPVLTTATCYTVHYRILLTGIDNKCGGGTTYTSFTVNANVCPQPAAITGPTPSTVCVGRSLVLSDATTGGVWTSSPFGLVNLTPSGSNVVVLGTFPGNATISYTLPGGCAATRVVTVNPAAPSISGISNVCIGATANYSLSTPATGTWSSSVGAVGTIDAATGVLTGIAAGTTTITFTESSTACFSVYPVTVNPIPAPIACNTPFCEGTSITLCDATSFGTWSGGSALVASINPTTGTVTGIGGGNANVTYTVAGCSVNAVVTVNPSPSFITGTPFVCVGGITTLGSTPNGGTWSGNNPPVASVGSSLGDVHGLSAGTVIVTYALSTGCFRTQIVTVNALPAPIAGPMSVCVGRTVTLTDASGGGTWTSSIPPIASIGLTTGVVSGFIPGTTTISYTFTATGCAATSILTVNPNPIPSNGIGELCPGQSALLSNSSPGTGTWISSNPSVATIGSTTGVVSAVSGGTTNITYTLSTGCFVVDVETVNPAPAPITGIPNTCIGFTTDLNDATTGGVWTSSNTTNATVDGTGLVSGLVGGTTTISYTLPTGCAASVIVTVDAIPAPIVGPFTVCLYGQTTLSHPVAGGTWSSSDTSIAKIFLGTGLLTGVGVGTATITYTLASGCTATTVVTVNPIPGTITGIQYLCQGASTSLGNPVGGGTWSSQITTIATVNPTTGVVTGIGGGIVNITYTLPAGCYTTAVVTVYALPAIIGVPLVCEGTSVALTGVPPGGFWTSTLPIIASVGSLSGIVTGHNTGTTVITYSLPTSCITTIIATVQPMPSATTGSHEVCVGLSTTLSNGTAGGGTWSSSDDAIASVGSSTGVVTGIQAGVVTITFTASATGCYATYSFTVNPLPQPISGPTEVCVNASITLTDANAGGTWSSSGINATVGSSTGVVTGVQAGVETIVYTLPTSCLTTYDVTVNPLPSPITGPTEVCFGYSITLGSATSGGTWSISPATVATISPTGVVTGVGTGTALVSYTISPTGCAATLVITVDPLPAPIMGALNLCVHDSTTLTDATAGGTWTSENIYIAVINPTTGLLATVSAGTVTITYTLPTGCYVTEVVTINPTPQPIVGPLQVCVGASVTLSNVTTGGSWSSSNPGIAIIGSADGIVTGIAPGTAFITYTLPSSCPRVVIVTVNPNPTTIVGDVNLCLGEVTTLTSSPVGGQWTSSDYTVAIPILTTGVVFSIGVGTAVITYMLPTGCYAATTIIVNPVPTAVSIAGDREICVGTSTTLSNPAYPGGTWSVSPSTVAVITNPSTGVIFGVGYGTATVVYTLPTGCDTFITIQVDSLPSLISGPGALCEGGNTITLTSSPAPGTWSSSNTTVATIGTDGVVTSGVAGTTTITYTINGTGCTRTRIITVNPNPTPITGLNHICFGLTTVLTAGTPGGTWLSLNPAIVSVVSIPTPPLSVLATANGVGSTTIVYTLPTGCSTTFGVTVNPLPTPITGSHVVCVNDSTQLTDTTAGGVWSSSNITRATVNALDGEVFGISAGTAIITYTLSTGCITTFTITVNPLPPTIVGIAGVCVGSTTRLYDTTATGTIVPGTWSSSNTSVATIGTDGVVSGIAPGTATIRFTLPTGCYGIIIVTVNPLPILTVSSVPTIICRNSSTSITVSGAGLFGSYVWTPATGLNCTTCATVTATPTVTTTYTIVGTTQFGCKDTATVTVVVDSALNDIKITGQDTICKGACTQLIATGRAGTYFNWRPSTGLSCTICDTVIACPVNTTVYNALAIDSLGCRDSLFITVTVMPLPKIKVLPNPAIVCRGSATQLHASDSFATASYVTKFAWFPNIFISCDTCSDPFVTDTFNLVYRVTGITPFGCIDSIKVPVTVLDSAINTINKDTTICEGQSAQLYATSFNADGARSDYYWLNPVAMNNRYIPNPIVTPTQTTTYALLITPNVCFPDTLYTTVQVAPIPEITITPSSATVASGTPVSLTASISNGVIIQAYAWSPINTLSCEICYNTVATPTVTTTYTFTATSVYGCTSSANVTVHIFCESSEVFIPNTFTPNGDGVNDRFYVSGKGISEITKFQVFNRWGELLYERHNISPNDVSAGWDGQYKGIVLEPDVFIYIVEATCSLGEHFTYKGDISIVR